ncbi:MAG: glycosyltransferase family 4 protein [Kiritimatiellae bacterium]|nr:glycosyltransferase family 4 protein [Kiritimatiellia bacterium]
MRIACFSVCMRIGGAEKVAAQLIGLWRKSGHETVLITSEPQAEREYDCEYVAREVLDRDLWVSAEKISELHEKHRFDVVVFNGGVSRAGFGDAVDWMSRHGVRTVMILHHTANNWMYTLGSSEDLWVDDVWRKLDAVVCVDEIWALWWKYRGMNSVFIGNPVSVSCNKPDTGEKRDASAYLEAGSRPGNLILVKNTDEAVMRLKGKRDIVWIGRLNDPLKRPELAIDVFAEHLRTENAGDGRATLTMLGACDKAVERQLRKRLAAKLEGASGNRPDVVFPGFVTNAGEYLKKADVHLFTSATEVTVPQVVREAQTAGVETVAFDIPVLRGAKSVPEQRIWETEEKWSKVLEGKSVECDFDTEEVRQRLMDEFQFSQQWFASHYLPTLHAVRRLKMRADIRYLFRRMMDKLKRRFKGA